MLLGENTLLWSKNVVINIFFEIAQLSTSTKPMLKEVFTNYTQTKVVHVATLLWESVRMKLTFPKWGLGSPPGLLKL